MIIPLPLPSIFDLFFRTGYDRPKLWLDLLQRATGKIRWMFMRPARVTVIKFDSYDHGPGNRAGYKALQDALKVCTYGRRDKRRLFYFGAIYDDNPDDLLGYDPNFVWKRTKHPRNAKIEVRVEEA